MRRFNSVCLPCRHLGLPNYISPRSPRLVSVPIRLSSLSAIHRGLRESERARPQGFKPDSLFTAPHRKSKGSTSRSRRDPDWEPPNFKIKKGKKDITDKGPQPKSRKARFNDPDESFGKKSLVYQLKHGKLGEQVASMSTRKSAFGKNTVMSKDDFEKTFYGSDGSKGRSMRPMKGSTSTKQQSRQGETRNSRDGQEPRRESVPPQKRSDFADTGRPRTERNFSALTKSQPNNEKDQNRYSRDRPQTKWEDIAPQSRNNSTNTGYPRVERNVSAAAKPSTYNEKDQNPYGKDTPQPRRESVPPQSRAGFADMEPPQAERNAPVIEKWQSSAGKAESRYARDSYQPTQEGTRSVNLLSRNGFNNTERPQLDRNDATYTKRQQVDDEKDDGPIRIYHTTAASLFLYGRSVVEAALKNSGRRLYRMYIYGGEDRQNISQDANLEYLARQKGIRITKVGRDGLRMMDKVSGGRPHNGFVLEASPLPQLPVRHLGPLSEDPAKPGYSIELGHQSREETEINGTSTFIGYQLPRGRKPFVLFLEKILDPGNLGAILRSAAFLGVNAVAISKADSAPLTAVTLKASAGASEVMTLFSVNSTIDFLTRSRESGWMVYAAVPSTSRSRNNSHLTLDLLDSYDPLATHPTILVVGSEGEGLDRQVKREADFEVSIPGASGLLSIVDSLNVSAASAILCSAFLKKQHQAGVEIEDSVPVEEGDEALW